MFAIESIFIDDSLDTHSLSSSQTVIESNYIGPKSFWLPLNFQLNSNSEGAAPFLIVN